MFNLNLMLLCLTLLDDATLEHCFPKQFAPRRSSKKCETPPGHSWPAPVLWLVVFMAGCACYAQGFQFIRIYMPGPEPVMAVAKWLEPLRSFNNYSQAPR
jgi:hypothetical protein